MYQEHSRGTLNSKVTYTEWKHLKKKKTVEISLFLLRQNSHAKEFCGYVSLFIYLLAWHLYARYILEYWIGKTFMWVWPQSTFTTQMHTRYFSKNLYKLFKRLSLKKFDCHFITVYMKYGKHGLQKTLTAAPAPTFFGSNMIQGNVFWCVLTPEWLNSQLMNTIINYKN